MGSLGWFFRFMAARVLYGFAAVAICSYVFFDFLDIDGSNLARLLKATHRAVVEISTPAEFETVAAERNLAPVKFDAQRLTDHCDDHAPQCKIGEVQITLLHRAGDHGNPLGLARSSLPDKAPDD